jgi:hypothetical protein
MQSGSAIISPGVSEQHSGGQVLGTLTITGNFQMFDGEMHIEFDKVSQNWDKVIVNTGYVKSGPNTNPPETFPGGKLAGFLIGPPQQADPFPVNTEFPFMTYASRHNNFVQPGIAPTSWHPGMTENVNPKNYWFKKSGGGGSGGGGGGGGSGGSGSSPLMGEITWDDKEPSDIGDAKAAVKLVDASGNFLAPSADDWAGPAAFGGLGEGSYQIDYVAPSTTPQSAPALEADEAAFAPEWSGIVATDENEQPYDIDAELAWGGSA